MSRRNILLLAVAMLAAAGCGSKSKKPMVAFVTNNPAEFWNIAQAGADAAAAKYEVELLFKRPQTADPAKQKEIVDTLLLQGVKAMAVSVIDPANQKDYFDGIADKIPFITQDNDVPDGKRLCYLGTDNYAAGRSVGVLVKEAMPEGGPVAIFVGQLEPLNARQRRQGVLDELSGQKDTPTDPGTKAGKYTLVGTYTDRTSSQKAKENAVDVLTQLSGEKAVAMVGLWAYNPPAIRKAAADLGRLGSVRIIGFDEDAVTLDGIEKGEIYGTVVQNPYEFGYQSVKLLAALARGDKSGVPASGMMPIEHRVITKSGGDKRTAVADFRAELNKLLGK